MNRLTSSVEYNIVSERFVNEMSKSLQGGSDQLDEDLRTSR